MSSTTDESESPRSGFRRLRIALIAIGVAFCLAVFYVLLSAPLLLYSAHHPGGSAVGIVEAYMQPLMWADKALNPEPLHSKILNGYYGLWGSEVEQHYYVLHLMRYLESARESMEESTPFLGADGPDSPIP